MAGAATDGDVLGARGSSANGPMAGIDCLTGYGSTRVKGALSPSWSRPMRRVRHLGLIAG